MINYSLDEITLIDAPISNIQSRKDINPFYTGDFGYNILPIFVSPMTCILDKSNICKFTDRILPILPVRNKDLYDRIRIFPDNYNNHWIGWTALTLNEFKENFVKKKCEELNLRMPLEHILIDTAKGNLDTIYKYVELAKKNYPKLKIMVGNISNPETYKLCCEYGVDYVRIGIGGGSGCTTACITGIHTSLPRLITEINSHYSHFTKVVADGGINTIDKAIKCLALGADYVMMGKCFAQTKESCGEKQLTFGKDSALYTHYYGQASRLGQIDRFGEVKSNPEGTDMWINVLYSLNEFINNFESSLRSSMSYANAKTLQEYIGKVNFEVQTIHEFNCYNK